MNKTKRLKFNKYVPRGRVVSVLEIGVAQGESARTWLSFDNVKYTGIDPWILYTKPVHEEFTTGMTHEDKKIKNWNTQKIWDDLYLRVEKELSDGFGSRVSILRGFSHQILPTLKEQFDIIYIDGNHSYEYIVSDLRLSAERVVIGGNIILDDFNLKDVKDAISTFMKDNKSFIKIDVDVIRRVV